MNAARSRHRRIGLLAGIALAGATVFLLLPPLRQPQSYHHFIDDRRIWGIPNCLNVLSNAPFALVGVMGLWFLGKKCAPNAAGVFPERNPGSDHAPGAAQPPRASSPSPPPSCGGDSSEGDSSRFACRSERLPFIVFFLGAFLTCFGSAYYHWAPDDATLAWDRLPMTLAFMALLAAVVGERIDAQAGLLLLWPLVIAGAATVWWWRRSGNLWPYTGAQYFSIILIGLILMLFPPRYTRSLDLVWVTGFYILAKVAEALDRPIFTCTGFVSGHTIKHLVAALAVYWVLRMLQKRSGLAPSTQAA
jgi:hypothetical protein